ncbi:MAG: hypothetical protein LBV32_09695 [Tannerellaceae bacterium]|jgi:hypothetical protein|nr:hypothetical protein [Tannerellaceae bacterium]
MEVKHVHNSLSEFVAEIQMEEEFYQLNFDLNNKMTGLVVPDIFCTKSRNERYLLSEIPESRPLLIYRYSHKNCTPCYIEDLEMLQEEFSDSFDLLMVLCSYQTERDFVIFKRLHQKKLPGYHIPIHAFDWIVEDYGNPYYFVLHPDMKISHVYVPNKIYPEFNRQYLEGVKRFLSK